MPERRPEASTPGGERAAEVLATRPTALYTGVALATNNGSPVLLAANFSEGTVDEYDSTLRLIGQFADRRAPVGYAPFNVQNVAGSVFVTYAKQNATKNGVDSGRGRGLIDVFNAATGTFHRFAGELSDLERPGCLHASG